MLLFPRKKTQTRAPGYSCQFLTPLASQSPGRATSEDGRLPYTWKPLPLDTELHRKTTYNVSLKSLIDPLPGISTRSKMVPLCPPNSYKLPRQGKRREERSRVRLGIFRRSSVAVRLPQCNRRWGGSGRERHRWPGTAPGPPRRDEPASAGHSAPRRPRARLRAASPLGLPPPGAPDKGVEGASVCAAAARGGPRAPGRRFPGSASRKPRFPETRVSTPTGSKSTVRTRNRR